MSDCSEPKDVFATLNGKEYSKQEFLEKCKSDPAVKEVFLKKCLEICKNEYNAEPSEEALSNVEYFEKSLVEIQGNSKELAITESHVAKRGRPRIKIDFDLVEELAAQGMTGTEIADFFGIARSTLYEHKKYFSDFSDRLRRGRARGEAAMLGKLFEMGMNGNLGAIKFYLQCVCGFTEKRENKYSQSILEHSFSYPSWD